MSTDKSPDNLSTLRENSLPTFDARQKMKVKNVHYHLRIDRIYSDKTLKICGICALSEQRNQSYKLQTKMSSNYLLDLESRIFLNEFSHSDIRAVDLTFARQAGFNNPLTELPSDILNFKLLTRLHFDGTGINSIPESLGSSLKNLEILTCSNNSISHLPDSMKNLKNLRSLHLNSNKFKLFPGVLLNLKNLVFLDMSNNLLETVPSTIEKLVGLETLLLMNNELKTVPVSLGKLEHLKTLWLGFNKLKTLPREVCNMGQLDWNENDLSLMSSVEGNPIQKPPMSVCDEGLLAVKKYFRES